MRGRGGEVRAGEGAEVRGERKKARSGPEL